MQFISIAALLAFLACTAAAPVKDDVAQAVEETKVEGASAEHGRELFPMLTIKSRGATGRTHAAARIPGAGKEITMSLSDASDVKGPLKALEMLAISEDMNMMVHSDSMCTRRQALARASGLAAGLSLAAVKAPGFAAETKTVKMGSDNGQLVFVPDEIKICKGDTVKWVNNKGGPHNVVFDEEAIPSGVSAESISMDGQLGEEGETFTKTFTTAGSYSYYCEPHRGAGMNAELIVE